MDVYSNALANVVVSDTRTCWTHICRNHKIRMVCHYQTNLNSHTDDGFNRNKSIVNLLCLPISSIKGAIRNVTPTSSKHITSRIHAVAMIVHLARRGKSSGSITCGQIKK